MRIKPYHFEVGNFNCIAIRDGGHRGSADFIFTNAPAHELAQALQAHALVADQLGSSWTCLLVDTGDSVLLVDTGVGSEVPGGGHLVGSLEELGYPADRVDMVFLTHGHPDHIGGCTDGEGRVVFGQARFVMGKKEFEFWTSEENLSSLGDMMGRFARKNLPAITGRLELVSGVDEILPGIRIVEAFGHTPGHLGLEIRSQGDALLHLADVALHPLHLEYPEWYAGVDIDPDQMVATRIQLLGQAARQGVKVMLFHFDFPSIGYLRGHGDTWRWQPVTDA